MATRVFPQRSLFLALAVAFGLSAVPVYGQEKLPTGARVARIEAQPAQVNLGNPYQYSQLLLTAVLESGERVDITRLARIDRPEKVVSVSPTGVVRPVADGEGALKITLAGQSASIPVKVQGQKARYEVSFVRDVMPTLSRMGCNAGTCHGAAEGKNGFKLSLRGYDPIFDHRALTDDLDGRRFNRVAPDTSLMLLKPSGGVPHVGGVLTRPGRAVLRAAAAVDRGRREVRLPTVPASPSSKSSRAW